MIRNIKYLLFASLTMVACNSDDDAGNVAVDVPITAGEADFSKYVSLGNSLTAGFSDNALFRTGQENSYPNIMAQQFALAGGGSFSIPYVNGNTGGLLLGGMPIQGTRLYLEGFLSASAPNIMQVPGLPTTDILEHVTGPVNNFGVPGAKSFHLSAAGYGNIAGVPSGAANPYFARFASSPSASVLQDAIAQNPTFFSLWIGNNDVLSYALTGGIGVNQTGNANPATYGGNDITDPMVFAATYNALIDGLTENGAKGVVANIPYVTSIPYFRTVPHNPVPLDAATAGLLNGPAGYANYNGGLQVAKNAGLITEDEAERRTITFSASANNRVVIEDEYLTNLSGLGLPSYRQATSEDLLILTARSFIGTTVGGNPMLINGVSVPLADNWVLSKDEVAEVRVAVDAYNVSIKSIADAKGLAFVDANTILQQVFSNGVRFGNYHLSASFITGGVFSLDGVHPGARGYAFIANEFLKAINETYGSNLPGVDLGDYQIQYPLSLE